MYATLKFNSYSLYSFFNNSRAMGKDDLLISFLLKNHDCLRSLAQAKMKGKDILADIYELVVEAQALLNRINDGSL